MLALLPLLIATASTPCDGARFAAGNAVLLPGSSWSVVVPDGWWLQSGAYPQRPELEFELPHACQGGVYAHPSLQVARIEGSDLADVRPASGEAVREAPVRTTIAGHPAVEYASTGTLIAHSLDGRGSLRPLYYRVVVVRLGDELFECRLTLDVLANDHVAAPRGLCATLAVRADAKAYER